MRSNSPRVRGVKFDEFGFPVSQHGLQPADEGNANSADEVIGEMGLVLVVILGIVVAVNLVLTSLHIG